MILIVSHPRRHLQGMSYLMALLESVTSILVLIRMRSRSHLISMYTNIPQMGGQFAEVGSDVDENWRVSSNDQPLSISYQDSNDESQALDFKLKEGDDIYQVATYINGQQDVVRASVN